jgi:transcriptional regulator with XRE-family HTH domain
VVDYNVLGRDVLLALARKPGRLTGNEIRFIRHQFEMSLAAFGARFDVTHPAVLKWERAGDKSAALKWPVEKDLRLFILDRLRVRASVFKELYESLREVANTATPPRPLDVDVASVA